MSPPAETPRPDSTASWQPESSQGRKRLTETLLNWLNNRASEADFHQCLEDGSTVVDDWITSDLRLHFVTQPEAGRREYVDLFPREYQDAVAKVWCEACRTFETGWLATQEEQNRLEAIQCAGVGGFGTVYKVFDKQLKRFVAIKFSHEPCGEQDFEEAQTAASLKDAEFVTIFDVVRTNNRSVMVMDWVDSPTLAAAIKQQPGPWCLRRACRIMISLLGGLGKVHAKGIAHNDLKPANLFLNDDDAIIISDLGGATKLGSRPRHFTKHYAAPEVLNKGADLTEKTDLYSAACIAYELLTGQRCHPDEHDGEYIDPRRLRPDLPKALVEALHQGLDRDSNKRPASTADLARLFQDFLAALPAVRTPDDHHLGPPPSTCFGRDAFIEAEVAAIGRAVGSPNRAKLYHGPGGIGKSTAAQHVARHPRLAEFFGPERYHLVLDGTRSADGIAVKLADAFGLEGPDRLSRLEYLLERRVNRLILLDTVDDPLAHAGPNVGELLERWAKYPCITLLLTARSDRAPHGDWLVKRHIDPLDQAGIVQVFHKYSGNKFRDDAKLNDVLTLAGGMPLAAKLLGWRAQEGTLAELLNKWEQWRGETMHQSDADRSLSVPLTVAFSLERPRLRDCKPAQRLLRLLAELPAGLLVADLPQLLPGDDQEALRIVRSVGGLTDESDGRLTMLAPIRDEICARIERDPDDWRRTICVYAEWLDQQGHDCAEGNSALLPRFHAERANFELLISAGIKDEMIEAIDGAVGLDHFGTLLFLNYRDLLEQAVNLAKAKGNADRTVECLSHLASALAAEGLFGEALRIYREEVLPVVERLGDVRDTAIKKMEMAEILEAQHNNDEALRIIEDQLPVFKGLDDDRNVALTLFLKAKALLQLGRPDDALGILREKVLPVFERFRDVRNTAMAMGQIAKVLIKKHRFEDALDTLEKQLPIYKDLGDGWSMAVTMGQIAEALQKKGQIDEALRIRRDEAAFYESRGYVRHSATTMVKIADLLREQNRHDEALNILEEQLPLFEGPDNAWSKAIVKEQIAHVLAEKGKLDEALRIRREEVLPICKRLSDVLNTLIQMEKIADLLAEKGELHESLRIYRQVLADMEKLQEPREQVVCRMNIAVALKWRGWRKDIAEAHQHLQWALAKAREHNLPEADEIQARLNALPVK